MSKNVLLLGMVFSEEKNPKRGQEYRDRVRCEGLEKIGFNVYTLDDKHPRLHHNKHCNANFSDARRMKAAMHELWNTSEDSIQFDYVILDYFFSPIGWARDRWSTKFFSETIPMLAQSGHFKKNGEIWLPHLSWTHECLTHHENDITKYFHIDLVAEPRKNPLYRATSIKKVNEELNSCPDRLTNRNQIKPLLDHSEYPFYVLRWKNRTEWNKEIEKVEIANEKKKKKIILIEEVPLKKRLRSSTPPPNSKLSRR